ncbi:hypothetical protein DXG03_005495 [Asterophora parasitica]|uniref:Glycosyl transferase CAP10 domain-containing protein n=1 Tax=Asterophora parasitica TaxID=117018 RepID=A0A9P7KCK0_9AGAR|nr:hypothetical protein DXG03_005495 [Asterophora parasitica]
MLAGPLSLRKLRFIFVPLFALVFSFIIYCREALFGGSTSTSFVRLPSYPTLNTTPSHPACTPALLQDEKDELLPHTFRDDGILEVNPDGGHPIYELMELANARWKSKLARASRTLDDAVGEYVRRYNRRPPKGFDKWWSYVKKHNVQLPDEYDQIHRDLQPFWGYHPLDLHQILSERELHTDTYTLGKNATSNEISVLRVSFARSTNDWDPNSLLGGARSIMEILRDVQDDLPPFRAVVSPHDSPTLFTDYEVKKTALEAADRGAYMDMDKIAQGEGLGWPSGCSASSPARQPKKSDASKKTFIFDHRKAMDPCSHPSLLENIGEFLIHERPGTSRLMIPQFAYCATKMHHDIQIPTLSGWVDDVLPRSEDPEFEHKIDERLAWRGSNTGMWHAPYTRWKNSQRTRLVDFASGLNGTVKVLIPPLKDGKRVGEGTEIPRSRFNPAMADMAFAGEPVGCHEETCPELLRNYEWRKRQGGKESGSFKYVLDVDGNAWSSRFKRLITSNSLIFKATVYPEWFLDRIEPWVHYVPVQVDYSDMYDALVFFRGGLYGEGAHPELARKIARDGRTWSRTFWRKEDVTAYVYRQVCCNPLPKFD